MRFLACLFLFVLISTGAEGQHIVGQVSDIERRVALVHVYIENTHQGVTTITDDSGKFSLPARPGELLVFKKLGFKVARLRLPPGKLPPYFNILMTQGAIDLPEFEVAAAHRDFKADSVRYRELYKSALSFERLSGLAAIQHPFSALSKRNRRIWAFQEAYTLFEQEKYIDYTFSEALVTRLTGLTGDSLAHFLRVYRPTYQQLRAQNEYGYYEWIKNVAGQYRDGRRRQQGDQIRSTR